MDAKFESIENSDGGSRREGFSSGGHIPTPRVKKRRSVQHQCATGTHASSTRASKSYRVRPRERTATTQRAVAQQVLKIKQKRNISTVRLLEAGARAFATKLLRLTPTGVRNEQAAVVREEQVLDLLLGGLVHVCVSPTRRHTKAHDRSKDKHNATECQDTPSSIATAPPKRRRSTPPAPVRVLASSTAQP